MEQHDNLHPEGVDMSRVRRFWKIFHCHMCGGDVKTQLYCPSCGHPFCRSCQREVVAEENVTKVVTSSQALDPFRSVDPSPNTVKPPMPTGKPTKKNREPDPVPDERPGVSSSAASEATTANVQREAIGKRESVVSIRDPRSLDILFGMACAQAPLNFRRLSPLFSCTKLEYHFAHSDIVKQVD